MASATVYFAPYSDTRGLSLIPPSTATKVRPPGCVLMPHTWYRVTPARALMARPGSITMLGRGKRSAAQAASSASSITLRQLVDAELRVAGQVRNPMAATDIQLGQDDAVPGTDVGHGGDHPANRLAVERGIGDLRADMTVQPDQVEAGVRQHARHRVRGVPTVEGEPELLVADPGGDGAVAVDVDVGGDPDQHPLPSLRQTGEVGDLAARIQHDAPDPDAHRGAQLVLRLRVAVHDDAGLFHAAGQSGGQFTG